MSKILKLGHAKFRFIKSRFNIEKLNSIIEEATKVDSSFITQCNISFPAKLSSIRRWMDELNFKCCAVKKSYMISMHEREDVRKDRKAHMLKNKENELNEPCFIRFRTREFQKLIKK